MRLFLVFVYCLTLCLSIAHAEETDNPTVIVKTNKGELAIRLFADKAPETVKNFLHYVEEGFYNGTVFHRVIPNFMIQGGGFDTKYRRKQTKAPIKNEASPFIPNKRGSVAMARTSDPNSATSQFFINVVNNRYLNKTSSNAGYAVFGEVIEGMGIADQISKLDTGSYQGMQNVPKLPVVIESIELVSNANDGQQ